MPNRFMILGLMLGLPLFGLVACKTGGDTKRQASIVTMPEECRDFPDVDEEVAITPQGFKPDLVCLKQGHKVVFLDECPNEVAFVITGQGQLPVEALFQGDMYIHQFDGEGRYTLSATGCGTGSSPLTGTLEVGTSPSEPPPEGEQPKQ